MLCPAVTVPEWEDWNSTHPCHADQIMLKGCLPRMDIPGAAEDFYSKDRRHEYRRVYA